MLPPSLLSSPLPPPSLSSLDLGQLRRPLPLPPLPPNPPLLLSLLHHVEPPNITPSRNPIPVCLELPPVSFLLAAAAAFALIGGAYFWLVVAPFRLPDSQARGCLPDGEGSWAVGMYYGKIPFELRPIELEGRSSANGSAWLVANPVLTCATATDAGYPSNFVADPFLYVQLTEKKLANSMRDIKVQKLVLDISVGKSSSPHLRIQGMNLATHLSSPSPG